MRKLLKKIVVGITAISLAATLPGAQTVYAAQSKNVNLGTTGLVNPGQPGAATDSWGKGQGSYVYYGNYPQSDSTGAKTEPIRWRVLDYNSDSNRDGVGDSVFLVSDIALDKVKYNTTRGAGNNWSTSNVKKWLNSESGGESTGKAGGFLNNAFNIAERQAIVPSYSDEDENGTYVENGRDPLVGSDLTGQKIFVLSAGEVTNSKYGFYKTALAKHNRTLIFKGSNYSKVGRSYTYTWLRSPVKTYSHLVGMNLYTSDYSIATVDNFYVDTLLGVIPAMKVNKAAVLFTSATGYKKDAFGPVGSDKVSSDWNMTIQAGTGFAACRKPGEITSIQPGTTVTVNVTAVPALTGGNKYTQISAMLVDDNNSVCCYGKISDKVQTGEIKVVVPLSVAKGNYKMYVFAEDVNSTAGNLTDYASNMVEMKSTRIPVKNVAVTGADTPIAGNEYDAKATCSSTGVAKVADVTIKNNGNAVTGRLQYDTTYSVEITLDAKEGYAFDTGMSATINGKNAVIKTVTESRLVIACEYTTEGEPQSQSESVTQNETVAEVTTEASNEAESEEEVSTEAESSITETESSGNVQAESSNQAAPVQGDDGDNSGGGLMWLWILLAVLAAAGVAGAIYYKNKMNS